MLLEDYECWWIQCTIETMLNSHCLDAIWMACDNVTIRWSEPVILSLVVRSLPIDCVFTVLVWKQNGEVGGDGGWKNIRSGGFIEPWKSESDPITSEIDSGMPTHCLIIARIRRASVRSYNDRNFRRVIGKIRCLLIYLRMFLQIHLLQKLVW